MNCPSCNHQASSFSRFVLTLQGVSIRQSVQGYLRCENCGALVRVIRFRRALWGFLVPTVALLIMFAFTFPIIVRSAGGPPSVAIWFLLLFLILFVFSYGLWRFGELEERGSDASWKDGSDAMNSEGQ